MFILCLICVLICVRCLPRDPNAIDVDSIYCSIYSESSNICLHFRNQCDILRIKPTCSYTTLWLKPKGCFIIFLRHSFNHGHCCSTHSSKILKTTEMSLNIRIMMEMYICRFEYYSALKKLYHELHR